MWRVDFFYSDTLQKTRAAYSIQKVVKNQNLYDELASNNELVNNNELGSATRN